MLYGSFCSSFLLSFSTNTCIFIFELKELPLQKGTRIPRTKNVCFFVVDVNDKHMEPGFKRKLNGYIKTGYAPNCV